jgi:N-acetylmuramoyl-L-alanine amidase
MSVAGRNWRGAGAARYGLLLALALAPGAAAARPGQVPAAEATGWRLGEHDAAQRLVIDLTKPVEFKIFTLSDPSRVVVDMPEIDWHQLDHDAPLQGGTVTRVRYGVLKPGISRLVVDAATPLKVRSAFMIEPREGYAYRLVVDLEPDTAIAPPPVVAPMVATPLVAAAAVDSAPPPPLLKPTAPSRVAAAPMTLPAPPPVALPVPAPIASAPPPVAAPAPPPPMRAPPRESTPSLLPSLSTPAMAAPLTRGTFESAAVVVPIMPAPAAPPVARHRADNRHVVVIDAGHGGVDPGAISLGGVYEKSITLGVAQEIEHQLTASGRYKVVMTRTDDTFVRLRERVAIARQVDADLFISIHADSLNDHSIGGMSIYTLSETASDREAEALAAKENKADIIAGVDLRDESPQVSTILIDLAQRETKNLSAKLARFVIDEIGRDRRLLPRPHRFAGFAVLTAPDVPSVLIELGYLSNRTDEHELLDPLYRQRMGRGIVRALDGYFAGRQRLRRS